MKIKIGQLVLLLLPVILLGTGCATLQTVGQPAQQTDAKATITYLVSKEDTIKYCNGADMDSEGYKKTITIEITTTTTKANMTEAELLKNTIVAATTGMCQEIMKQFDFKIDNGIAHIPSIEGWAGVSITMCSCKPQVEVNVLRIPGIKQVIWE